MPRRRRRGFYPRGNKWQVDTSYKGIRIRELVATEEMAEKELRKAQTLIDENRYLEMKRKSKATLGRFLEKYLQWCKGEGQKAFEDKSRRLKRMVHFFGKDLLLSDIDPQVLESYKADRLSHGRKAATVNRDMCNFKHLLTKAVEWSLLSENVGSKVKLLPVQNQSLRYLSGEELERLVNAASGYLRPLIIVAVTTGLRRGELLALKWTDVNFKTGYIQLLDQKNGQLSYIPMNPEVIAVLHKIPHRFDSPYVFSKRNGKAPMDVFYGFQKALKRSGIAHCTFHSLRHTFASHLCMSGVDLLTVRELLRHKSYAMTL